MEKISKTQKFKKIILENASFILVPHPEPDGDAIGSILSLSIYLQNMGKDVYIYSRDKVSSKWKILPNFDKIKYTLPQKQFDVLISCDIGNYDRLLDVLNGTTPKGFAKYVINIDHHIDNNRFGDLYFVRPDASSTTEVIFDLLKRLNIYFTDEILINILAGIIYDTGGFHHNLRPPIFQKLSDILKLLKNISLTQLLDEFNKINFSIMKIKGRMYSRIQSELEGRVVWSYITILDLKKLGLEFKDIDKLVNDLGIIDGVDIYFLLKDYGDKIKVSLRSKKVSILSIAHKFGGGGHSLAAGFPSPFSIESTKNMIIKELKDLLK